MVKDEATGEDVEEDVMAKKTTCVDCDDYEIRHPNYKFGCMR